MLQIATDILPQSGLSYVAFRVAFQDTLERIALANQVGERDVGCYGFLTEVPFLKAVAPHVQLDLLAETWAKHVADVSIAATLVDESVVYAACETAARLAEHLPADFARHLNNGPFDVEIEPDDMLASELRELHLNLPSDGDFLLVSQFEDLPPETAQERGLDYLALGDTHSFRELSPHGAGATIYPGTPEPTTNTSARAGGSTTGCA